MVQWVVASVMDEDVELLLSSSLNVDHSYDSVNISHVVSSDEERPFNAIDTSCATSELLQNGIFVETKQGLVCLTLKDALTSGLGGLNLSVEDLQHVAEQFMVQNAAVVGSNLSIGSLSEVSEMSEVELPSSDAVKTAFNCFLSAEPSSPQAEDFLETQGDLAQLDMGLSTSAPNLQNDQSEPVMPRSVQVPVSVARANASPESSQKKRGGWPKGRKRKPEVTLRPPKAPATGYVLYLNEKRKMYKDMPFPDVTKLLGNEWSRMGLEEKRIYLDRAEMDKKRYKQELLLYRKSDAYRSYLNEQRLKRTHGNGTEESDMDATDEIEEEDNEELYCRTCDQWFSTHHNKKEHLYGRQHLQSISNDFTKKRPAKKSDFPEMEGGSSCSLDDSSLDAMPSPSSAFRVCGVQAICEETIDADDACTELVHGDPLGLTYMDDAVGTFIQTVVERERETTLLQQRVHLLNIERDALEKQLSKLQEREAQMKSVRAAEQARSAELESQLFTLVAVPALFLSNESSTNLLEVSSNSMICSDNCNDNMTCEIPSADLSGNDVVLVITEDMDMTDITGLRDALIVS